MLSITKSVGSKNISFNSLNSNIFQQISILPNNFFLINCDSLIDIDLNDFINYHNNNNYDMTIVSVKKNYSIPYGVIKIDKNNQVKTIEEKPTEKFIISTGLYLLNVNILNILKKPIFIDMNEIIKKAIDKNYKIGIYLIDENKWIDVGNWNEYLKN